jgi:putative ABC transport system substrate-binding protein
VGLQAVGVQNPAELDGAFATIAQTRPGVVIDGLASQFAGERRRVAELALKHRLPTMSFTRDYVEAGGLIAYGTKLTELFRRAPVYVDKILKGAKPGDLPIEQPTKFELVINMRTAKTLGLTIPPSVLARADAIIE